MSTAISLAAKFCIGIKNEKFSSYTCSSIANTRAEATVIAPKKTSWRISPELSIQGIPHTFLEEAYERCRNICAEYAKTFYLGTLLMTEERQKAIWAIYVWCRRTDELVDGPKAIHMSFAVLDRWEERLEDLFKGRPYDMLDATLTYTVNKFPLDIKPFRDMIEGMRMDTRKSQYQNFQDLYLYCHYVARNCWADECSSNRDCTRTPTFFSMCL